MSNLTNALQIGGYLSGIPKQKYLDLERKYVNAEAKLDIFDMTSGATDIFWDLYDGYNDHSVGQLDTTKTKATSPLTAGDTNLITKVDTTNSLIKWFQTGQEITIVDDVNSERVIISNGGVTEEITTIDRSTPTTVVSSAYTTLKDARPQVLSNGWIVTAVYDSTTYRINLYVSENNGTTLRKLCYIYNGNVTINGFSLASNNLSVYIIFSQSTDDLIFAKIDDVTAQTDIDIVTTPQYIEDTQTAMGGCSLTINEAQTELHACWSSKNSTYPNSFNIRYCKGTISAVDGSVTWGSVVQVTTANTSGMNLQNPSIALTSTNPVIVMDYTYNSTYSIYVRRWNGSSWLQTLIYDGGSYAQSSPDLICSHQNGILWVTWYGKDAVDTSYDNIHCKYSIDGGVNWLDGGVTGNKITSGNFYPQQKPSITSDKDGKIYIMFQGVDSVSAGTSNIMRIVRSGTIWGSITKLTSSTTSSIDIPSTCNNYTDFTDPICIYRDGLTSSVKFRGVFNVTTSVPHLEVTPLQNAYKTNALVYRSLGNVDTTSNELTFSSGFESTTTYDVSTPVNVVASAYDTSGNGGRKLVRLSNGWLVGVAFVSGVGIYFYVYKPEEQNPQWQQLCYLSSSAYQNSGGLTSYGTNVYLLAPWNNTTIQFVKFDATTISNIDIYGTLRINLESQTALGSGCSIEADSTGTYLHACWSSKNSSYPSSFNIRYSKGTIAGDGSVSWSAVTQATVKNETAGDIVYPCIIIRNNKPVIIFINYSNNTSLDNFWVGNIRYDGTSWSTVGTGEIYMGSSYTQSNPSACVDSAGVIHVVWHGLDSVDNAVTNIRYSKSNDGGATWITAEKRTIGNLYVQMFASVACDNSNNIYILWNGQSVSSPDIYQIRKIVCSNGSWGNPTNLTSNTTANAIRPSICSNFTGFTDPLCIYQDAQAGAVKFRGVWSDEVFEKFVEESVIYDITPPVSSGQIASWVKYQNNENFSIDSKFSIINSGNETYLTPTKKTTVIDENYKEDQYVISAPVGSNIKQKIIMTRASSNTDYYVYQVLGALG